MTLWALATFSDAEDTTGGGAATAAGGGGSGSGDGSRSSVPGPGEPLRAPPELLPALCARAGGAMALFGPQALSNMLWALARLGVRPSNEWLMVRTTTKWRR